MPRFDPSIAEAYALLPEAIASSIFDGATLKEEQLGPPMKRLLQLARFLATNGAKRSDLVEMLKLQAPDADHKIEAGLRQHFEAMDPKKARVLCVTTDYTNDAMWGNYAESHTGCVLGFRDIEELSTPLLEAQPVTYTEDRPVVGSGLDFLLYGDSTELRKNTLRAVCFTKKIGWSYEQEWRALTWRPNEHSKQHGDYLFYPDELESVTLGARASNETEERIREVLSTKYPTTTFYRMKVVNGELKRSPVP